MVSFLYIQFDEEDDETSLETSEKVLENRKWTDRISTAENDLLELHKSKSPKCPVVQRTLNESDVSLRHENIRRSKTIHDDARQRKSIVQRISMQNF